MPQSASMLATIRHSSPTVRVDAEIVAASSNHSEGRAAPAALTTTASTATPTASHGARDGAGRLVSTLTRGSRSVVVVTEPVFPRFGQQPYLADTEGPVSPASPLRAFVSGIAPAVACGGVTVSLSFGK